MTDIHLLTLYAPRIPGWKDTVPAPINAHGGIPLALTYLYPEGVKVFVDGYLEQEVGDNIDLYLNGVVVSVAIVESLTDKRFILYLPVKALFDGLNEIYYSIRRGSENIDSSTTLRAWFHKRRPGLKDLEGNHESHSELGINVLPPQVVDDGVDPEQARQGVICTAFYPLTRAFDKIRVRCGGESIEHEVSEDEAKSGEPVEILIDEAVFKKIGDTPKCVVTYTVWDWIGNSVDLDALWSAAIELFVSLNGTWYEPPLVSEDPNDASDDPDSIDLGKLAGQPAIAQVHAQRSWLRGDIIELTCTFTSATDSSEVLVLKETVDRAPFIYKLPVPHAQFVRAVGGSARFKYKLLRGGKEVGRSFTTTVDVIGEALIELPLVTVVGVPGLVVDPLAYPEGLIARIEFAKAQTGDTGLQLVRPVTAEGFPMFPAKAFNANKRVNNTLTIQDLVARHGTVIRLPWELTRNGVKTRSKPTLLTVQKIVDGDPRLPTPKVPQAPDDKVLDFSKFEGDAEVKVLPWLGIREGQEVELKCVGIDSGGGEYVIPLLKAFKVTTKEVSSGLSVPLRRKELAGLKHDSKANVSLSVLLGQNTDQVRSVLFPIRELTVQRTLTENFDNQLTQIIVSGQTIETSVMRIGFVSGGGMTGIAPTTDGFITIPEKTELQVLHIGYKDSGAQRIALNLKKPCNEVSFWYGATNVATNVAYFYGVNGLLGQQFLLLNLNSANKIVFSETGIVRIEIQNPEGDWLILDNFSFSF
ncbi:hypothetical protein F475_00971 [Pseudomonas sp. URMO17WK12:I6]|jgi:hypothetical protein|uniref:hypothetical protein n=1 Tax=Pseudomonas sp. URMO17WK12:I6 TaxID=1261629 RepID=UPI000DAF05EE|nr:hypothetical protein [Pseudomonas sp. URMO17WK12:I6]PZW64898.1 hypothetical protein F475_00971 [Pseudomonas sp. URMO17WK12:I6]